MEYILHIKPTFDCLLKSHNTQTNMKAGIIYSFLANASVTLLFYPLEYCQNNLPFCYNFDSTKPRHNSNVKVTDFKNNNFLLSVSPFYIGKTQVCLLEQKKVKLNEKTHSIFFNTNASLNLKVECDTDMCEFNFEEKIYSLKTKALKNNILIYALSQTKSIIVLLEFTQDKYKTILCDIVDILEEENNEIKTYKSLFDFANHGVVNTYKFLEDLNPQTQLVYANSTPFLTKHKIIIPYAFFEAIKIKNYKLARFYLSSTLSKKLTDKHLETFFGCFNDISQSLSKDAENEIALIYTNDTCNTSVTYELKFDKNNKITNITEKEF